MSRALERNDKNCSHFPNMKSIPGVDVIVCTRQHLRSSLNLIVCNSNSISCIHRRGQHFYKRFKSHCVLYGNGYACQTTK